MSQITLNGIRKQFGDHVIFENFNLQVEQGEMIALCGQSGCGKSTLLNMIGLLETPDDGQLEIDGVLNPKPNSKRATLLARNTIGYLFQNYALVDNMTVDKNLDIALEYVKESKQAKKELKQKALEQVGIADKINSKVYELSGGEQQRVAIARLMLKPCSIILADEPTGSLDPDNRDIVIDLLKHFNSQGKTILIATHDSNVSYACNRIVQL